ncbi:MAG TPA: hypothetical protein VJ692_11260 [Nitrospiraceae bacterium]|nr:hypothetical protein [Nitrospiraceae bacterium]
MRRTVGCRRWRNDFFGELVAVGIPVALVEGLITEPALAIDIEVTERSPRRIRRQ